MTIKKRIVSAAMAAAMLITASPIFGSVSLAYNDTSGHWAEGYINDMEKDQLLEQFGHESIHPEQLMTRSECAELIFDLLHKYFNLPDVMLCPGAYFPDLTPGTPNTDKIRTLGSIFYYLRPANGETSEPTEIINGYPDGLFKPNDNVTRAEFAKMLYTGLDAMGYINIWNPPMVVGDSAGYDVYGNYWHHWGHKYLNVLYSRGVMNGYSSHPVDDPRVPSGQYIEFKPDNNITRAEAIKMACVARGLNKHYFGLKPGHTTRAPEENNLYYLNYDYKCLSQLFDNKGLIDSEVFKNSIFKYNNLINDMLTY